MYRVVAPESMSCSPLKSLAVAFARVWEPKHSGSFGRFFILTSLLVVLLGTGGCGTKTLTGGDTFTVVEAPKKYEVTGVPSQKTGTPYLPSDDGQPLSPEELNAFMSEGELDRNLSAEDMRDVMLHFKHLVHKGRYTVEKNVERGQLYLPYITQILREKGLPVELAYVAFIESGYNPIARSRTGATGMWQFISSTGKHYGMEQNWWIDERRDPYQATRAAADYLSKLYKLFNDWPLAITAYNAGEGKISRGLAATGTHSFFDLRRKNDLIAESKDQLTDENKQYLPKLLAVCKIMRNLDRLGFSSPDMLRAPRIVELQAKPGTDLMALAQSVGMSWSAFSVHNPAYQRYVSPPDRSCSVYVPQHMHAQAQAFLRKPSSASREGWRTYTVKRGDTMTAISRRTGIPVADLRRINQVSEPLKAGRKLKIPGNSGVLAQNTSPATRNAPSASSEKASSSTSNRTKKAPLSREREKSSSSRAYEVKAGDTIYAIANRFGVEQQVLLAANKLQNHQLRLGQKLVIPPSDTDRRLFAEQKASSQPMISAAARKNVTSAKNKIVSYRVQEGDSLWAIARKFNVSPIDLLALNKMDRNDKLRPGDTVRVAVN